MNNEVKILKLLETIALDVVGLKKGQATIETRMDKLELRMENEAFDPIRLLSENVLALSKRQADTDKNMKFLVNTLDRVANKIDDHTDRLERIEDEERDLIEAEKKPGSPPA